MAVHLPCFSGETDSEIHRHIPAGTQRLGLALTFHFWNQTLFLSKVKPKNFT